jgi:hypothetical protein
VDDGRKKREVREGERRKSKWEKHITREKGEGKTTDCNAIGRKAKEQKQGREKKKTTEAEWIRLFLPLGDGAASKHPRHNWCYEKSEMNPRRVTKSYPMPSMQTHL